MILGSHVGMSGKDMLLGSAKEAVSYGADTFMFYTGAPQNTRRKDISELNTPVSLDPSVIKSHSVPSVAAARVVTTLPIGSFSLSATLDKINVHASLVI